LKTLLVGNLSGDVSSENLQTLFDRYGEILGVDLAVGQDFGYVRMADDSEAYRAVTGLNGTACGGRMLEVTVPRAYSSRKREVPAAKPLESLQLISGHAE